MTRVFIPADTSAKSLGADQLVTFLQNQTNFTGEIIRNGSRGLTWLEPLIEVETENGRFAYGPVTLDDLEDLLTSGMLEGAQTHPLALGLTDEIPFLKNQQRLTFQRVGITDPLDLTMYQSYGGGAGLKRALELDPQSIVNDIKTSELRGRGGAAFPAGIKWQTVLNCDEKQKYIVCNADEGDSGTFADRMLMEGDPFALIEGMIIAGLAVGANQGYIYLREEYPQAHIILTKAITLAYQSNWLGPDILNSGKKFHLEVRLGAGAYICGEETSLLESLEGKRGQVRFKPPLPAIEGLFGKPTVVNNVLTLATVPVILSQGASYYQNYGAGSSRGTMPFQLSGNLKNPGLVELAFGITVNELINNFGGGSNTDQPLRAIQIGGPLGAYLPESQWDTPLEYEAFKAIDAVLGHGGLIAFDDTVDMLQQAKFSMEFCAAESCGKCTPCRIGSTRGVEIIETIATSSDQAIITDRKSLLADLCETMIDGSLCALGGMAPIPVLSAIKHFEEDFDQGANS